MVAVGPVFRPGRLSLPRNLEWHVMPLCFQPLDYWPPANPGGRYVRSRGQSYPGAVAVRLACGGCMACRLRKAQAWTIRLCDEMACHEEASFLTLTYSPEHYPARGSAPKRDLQLFVMRLRKWLGSRRVRTFGVMEYGDGNGRTHLHVIVFGYAFSDREPLGKSDAGEPYFQSASLDALWGKGRASVQDFSPATAGYVAGYAVKKIGGEMAAGHYRRVHPHTGELVDVEPEWMLCSRRPGIGFLHFDQFERDAFPSGFLVRKDRKLSVPSAYRRRWLEGAGEALLGRLTNEREDVVATLARVLRARAKAEDAKIAAGRAPSFATREEVVRRRMDARSRMVGGSDV